MRKGFKVTKEELKANLKPSVFDGIIPFFIQFIILVAVILEFVFLIANSAYPDVKGVPVRSDELNDPNIVRLIYMLLTIPIATLLLTFSVKSKSVRKSFWLSLIAGILAWQCVGECSWHFGLPVIDKFVFFPKIEGIEGTFVLALFLPLCLYLIKSGKLGWGIKVFIIAFFCNWVGHWLILGPASWFAPTFYHTWGTIAGYVFGLGGSLFICYLFFFKAETLEERLILSLLLYTTVGMFVEGAFGLGASLE